MDRPTLYLHIGPHKTGTTYLQMLLSAGAALLREEGLLYPDPGNGQVGHHLLAEHLSRGEGDEPERIAAAVRGFSGDAVLSSENFSRLDGPRFSWFRKAFPDHRIQAIHFLRSRGGALHSLWQESVKHGSERGLTEYVARVLLEPYANPVINPGLLISAYEATVDDYGLVVYDNVILHGSDLFEVFMERCLGRAKPDGLPEVGRVNRSLDPVRVELIRLLNHIHTRRGGPRNHFLRDRFLEKAGSMEDVVELVRDARRSLEGSSRSLPMENLDRIFLHLDRELLRRADGRVVNGAGGEIFAGVTARRFEYFAPEESLELLGGWPAMERLYALVA